MEHTVHPFEGAEQGVFISDVSLGWRRKRQVGRSWPWAPSQSWPQDPTQGQEDCGVGSVTP